MNTILQCYTLQKYSCWLILCLINLIVLLSSSMAIAQPILQLSSAEVLQGGAVTLGLSVSDATGVAYGGINADIILPSCASSLGVYPAESLPDSFVIHSVPYRASGVNGIKLIAYSATESPANNTPLANIVIQVADNCSAQIYPITFAPSNSDDTINIKHAITSLGSVSVNHSVADATLTVRGYTQDLDSDNDGMNDDWERFFFGDLSHDGTADSDGDGYTDLQEFLNYIQGITDGNGNIFDPTVPNAAHSPGYNDSKSSFWILMMPALLMNADE